MEPRRQKQYAFLLLIALYLLSPSNAFTVATRSTTTTRQSIRRYQRILQVRESSSDDSEGGEERTTFDQAGASLIQEEDQKRMEQMGDFDSNPSYQTDNIEQMRAAIRARTADLGIEKSKVSADYIAAKEAAAQAAGSAAAASEQVAGSMFGGLDLSQISDVKDPRLSKEWDEDLPTMFYDPEDEMTLEEQEEADPLMKKSVWEQWSTELQSSTWPDPPAALREVAIMIGVVAVTGSIIIGWDQLLRQFYTHVGFIPTQSDIANYANQFDGLDLPDGFMNNMNEQDVGQLQDIVNQ